MKIRPLENRDRLWAKQLVTNHFGSSRVVTRGVLHETDSLSGLIAVKGTTPVGLLYFRIEKGQCEVVVLIAERQREGIGSALLRGIRRIAEKKNCHRVWLITTNANREAQAFYRAMGMRQYAVYPGALTASRALKPEIPLLDENGRVITDEIEFEWLLTKASTSKKG